jgi:ubiquinone biosynthesis protein Coq4
VRYDPDLTLRAARQIYFDANGFDNGGYAEKWVKLKAGPFRFAFPNIEARVRSVKLHDLHHVITEYDTTWRGEAEIGAWELASGCARHWPAWVLNLGAVSIGVWLCPRLTWRAWKRGRRSRNLYRETFDEAMLDQTVGELRARMIPPPAAV